MANAAPSSASIPRGPGRPREFDIDEALDKATRVFCERGYHATSIGDLTEAMQLAQGSLYKAFKDKRAVFLAAFDRNAVVRGEKLQNVISTGRTGLDRIREALTFHMEASHGAPGRQGCLVVGSAAELATFDDDVAQRVAVALDKSEALMAELIRQGQADGSIPSHIDSEATARLMLCLLQGMRVVGKTGRTREEMAAVVEVAMRTLA
jgi:TetR/AcrR family transcriptional regulator, transcriptional repressor for nem operon